MVPKHNPDIIWRIEKRKVVAVEEALADGEDVSDSGTVTLILSGTMHQLNFVGGKIWAHCDGSNSVDDIAALLAEEFDVEQDEVHAIACDSTGAKSRTRAGGANGGWPWKTQAS